MAIVQANPYPLRSQSTNQSMNGRPGTTNRPAPSHARPKPTLPKPKPRP